MIEEDEIEQVKKEYWFGKSIFSNKIFSEILTFSELAAKIMSQPEKLDITRSDYHELPKKSRAKIKNGSYILAAGFDTPTRDFKNATHINLLTLDIDDSADAAGLLNRIKANGGLIPSLEDSNYMLYDTLSSTVDALRLRLIIDVKAFPVEDYSNVVELTAESIGIKNLTTESKNHAQPMLFPKTFKIEDESEGWV